VSRDLIVSNHAWIRWRQRVTPSLPRAEARAWLDSFIAGGRVSTRARRWTRPTQDGRRLPLRRKAQDPSDERHLLLLYNPLLAGVALLLEGDVVLTVVTDDRPRVPNGSLIVPGGQRASGDAPDEHRAERERDALVEHRP